MMKICVEGNVVLLMNMWDLPDFCIWTGVITFVWFCIAMGQC